MTINFDSLASDFRLHDLFGDTDNLSATQLWVLEIERENTSEVKFLYGRSLPGTFRADKWTGTTSSKTPLGSNSTVKTHALTLHTSADKLKAFVRSFLDGASLREASLQADIALDAKLVGAVVDVNFGGKPTFRPVMHFPSHDLYFYHIKRLSPTSLASANTGAISSPSKTSIFATAEEFESKLARAACDALDADTGMKFGTLDAWRLGDFEFVCVPGLTKSECRKFELKLKGENSSFKLFEPLTRDPAELLVIVNSYSDGGLQTSYITSLSRDVAYPVDHIFAIDTFQNQVATAYSLEIYAIGTEGGESNLLLQTGSYFIRSMSMNMQVVESIRSTGRMDWLARQVPNKEKAKLDAAGRISRAHRPNRSEIGGHTDDPWVTQNRLIEDDVGSLLPKPSNGRFFQTLSVSGGTSRLQLTDWLRKIFEQHHDAQVAWIDPYMENVGIDLLNTLGTATSEYLIITTEKLSTEDSKAAPGEPNRIQKLLASCAAWGKGYYGNVQLRVLAVPETKLHDRMILIRAANGRPIAGYHLSNSIQRANIDHPLLATPIPLDVLPNVFKLADGIIQSTMHTDGRDASPAKLIFDSSTESPEAENDPIRLSHRSSFTDQKRSGDVFAWWLDDPELAGRSGSELQDLMQAKGNLKEGKLDPQRFEDLPAKLWNDGLVLPDFHSAWDAIGFVLAHSQAGQIYNDDQTSLPDQLTGNLLAQLSSTRTDALAPQVKKSYLDFDYYQRKNLEEILLSNDLPERVFGYSTTDTAWSDYYAIKILWLKAPQALVNWLDQECSSSMDENPRRRALVVQALRLICPSLGFEKDPSQIAALLGCKASILVWVGVHTFKHAINADTFTVDILGMLDLIKSDDQRTTLCWLINEANYVDSSAKHYLVARLIASIESQLSDAQLRDILHPVRGRLGKLHHLTPWILESLLIPMLGLEVIDAAQVSREWLGDLTTQWKSALKGGSLYFKFDGDGAFTDELATLSAHLAPADQQYIVGELSKIFNNLARTVRQPLSAQVDWTSYIRAHEVNLWLYALARRIAALIHTHESQPLKKLLEDSESLIERLSVSDWETLTSRELLKYLMGDPDQIKSHRLLDTIAAAIDSSL
ncbi:VPA1262 family protein [Pseudomonas sp. UMAB-40]|uniref:VPA1262 family protein n=1 Tax=Pseudomonas sp. UMAB-40 TaxID=1365407 RepID=UPI001C56B718|nr:VPA1262 family protein [Pseudomonas sp. UMAB-40]